MSQTIVAQFPRITRSFKADKAKDGSVLRVARVHAVGDFAKNDDRDAETGAVKSAGFAFLDLVFVEDADSHPAGRITDLTGKGDSLEITAAFPCEMMHWVDSVISSCDETHPLSVWMDIGATPDETQTLGAFSKKLDAVGRMSDRDLDRVHIQRGTGIIIEVGDQ